MKTLDERVSRYRCGCAESYARETVTYIQERDVLVHKIETVTAIIGAIASDGAEDNEGKTGRGKEETGEGETRETSHLLVCCCCLFVVVVVRLVSRRGTKPPHNAASMAAVLITTLNGEVQRGEARQQIRAERRQEEAYMCKQKMYGTILFLINQGEVEINNLNVPRKRHTYLIRYGFQLLGF